MATPSAKALMIASRLAEALTLRCSAAGLGTALAVSEGSDSSGNPTILVGAAAAGAAGAFIRVMNYDQPNSFNIIGSVAPVYTPHVVQVAFEANPAGGAGADVNSLAQLGAIMMQCELTGCRIELWQSANGTEPSVTTFGTASNRKLVFEPNMYFPMVSDQ